MLPKSHFYLPFEMGMSFIWTNLNLLYPKMLCVKFGWNFLFHHNLPIDLNESHSPKDAVYQVWFILAQWCWRRILKVLMHHVTLLLMERKLKIFEDFWNIFFFKIILGTKYPWVVGIPSWSTPFSKLYIMIFNFIFFLPSCWFNSLVGTVSQV